MVYPENFQSAKLGEYAHQLIQQHFKRCMKFEKAVLDDEDPEALHQMRVGMRRLRTALQIVSPALDVPTSANPKYIRRIAQVLGRVRDADVLKAELETRYRPQLSNPEADKLDLVLKHLRQQRKKDFKKLKKTLSTSAYQDFKQGDKTWLQHLTYKPVAELPIGSVLPDLLLPLISELLLHPGWLVGYNTPDDPSQSTQFQPIAQLLDQQGEVLHSLRKQMKQVRYQTEFFEEFYSPDYAAQVQDFKGVQELLGQIQDHAVLSHLLTSQLGGDLEAELPTLAHQFQESSAKLWKDWQPIQQRYLNPDFRGRLRSHVLTPLGSTPQI
ncbi:MAG: CHAD domain-containing protein [Leptolyngbyaceae bacterium]|nr:CHAD domain-containing protein [Leptolyngbyaceae bacterium]